VPLVDPRDAQIAERDALIAELTRRLDQALVELAAAKKRIVELEARLGLNSRNSSKPPSSDPPGTERPCQEGSGRKRGGQPGHEPSRRELLPPEKVDLFEDHWPTACEGCKQPLPSEMRTEVGEPVRHQVTEIPRVQAQVTEHRLHGQLCECCGHVTEASLPPVVPSGAFGHRLRALVALCAGRYRLSKRVTQELLSDVLGVDLALGSVSNVERQMSEALAAPVEQARQFVREQPVVHADETGWREAKGRAWLWTATTALVTVFQIAKSRGAQVIKGMLGEGFSGFLVVDRWSAYEWVELRQLCWAHLLRDFQGFVDRGGRGAVLGRKLLATARRMFELWHRVRDKTLRHRTFQRRMGPIERRILRLLREAQVRGEPRTAGMAREILDQRDYLWTFVSNDGIEPTNNAAERAIRPVVLWRKGSFGTDSSDGSRFVERILTTATTLKQQGRNVLDYLARASEAHAEGRAVEPLLPLLAA
jgi:transposase